MNDLTNVKKNAYLVTGVSRRAAREEAHLLRARLRKEDKRFILIDEEQIASNYVKEHGMNPLCLKEWSKPIYNEVIFFLLDTVQFFFDDPECDGIIITGQFMLDQRVREAYVDILREIGFITNLRPILCRPVRTIMTELDDGSTLEEIFANWNHYNRMFSRQYCPDTTLPKAVVVDSRVIVNDNKEIYTMILGLINEGYTILWLAPESCTEMNMSGKVFTYDKEQEPEQKLDIFWVKFAYHYNVTMVIETQFNCMMGWLEINIPTHFISC